MDHKIKQCFGNISFYIWGGALFCALTLAMEQLQVIAAAHVVSNQIGWLMEILPTLTKLSGFGMATWYAFRALLITRRLLLLQAMRRRILSS